MSDEPRPRIMPGDRFMVAYADGQRQIEVVALAGKKQRELGRLLDELRDMEKKQQIERACEIAEEALCLCMDEDKARAMWETELDIELACEIAGATFGKQSLTVEELKKADSPH